MVVLQQLPYGCWSISVLLDLFYSGCSAVAQLHLSFYDCSSFMCLFLWCCFCAVVFCSYFSACPCAVVLSVCAVFYGFCSCYSVLVLLYLFLIVVCYQTLSYIWFCCTNKIYTQCSYVFIGDGVNQQTAQVALVRKYWENDWRLLFLSGFSAVVLIRLFLCTWSSVAADLH